MSGSGSVKKAERLAHKLVSGICRDLRRKIFGPQQYVFEAAATCIQPCAQCVAERRFAQGSKPGIGPDRSFRKARFGIYTRVRAAPKDYPAQHVASRRVAGNPAEFFETKARTREPLQALCQQTACRQPAMQNRVGRIAGGLGFCLPAESMARVRLSFCHELRVVEVWKHGRKV